MKPRHLLQWDIGFYSGVLAALAHLDPIDTAYNEIVCNCGADNLMLRATVEGLLETSGIANWAEYRDYVPGLPSVGPKKEEQP